MIFKVFADLIVVIHFTWILFMLVGFILTLCGFFWREFFDWWLFRTVHLFGIVYVTSLALLREYCPLTILENSLRERYNHDLTYPGSFIAHYIEKLVYPDVNPLIILIPLVIIAVFTMIIFILRLPEKIKRLVKDVGLVRILLRYNKGGI